MSARILDCIICGTPCPELSGHDETRCICSGCVQTSLRPGGHALRFPRDEQTDFDLTAADQSQPEALAV